MIQHAVGSSRLSSATHALAVCVAQALEQGVHTARDDHVPLALFVARTQVVQGADRGQRRALAWMLERERHPEKYPYV